MKLFMQPPQSIEEIKAGLETTEKGGVRQSIRNCLTVFQRDPLLSGAIAYNILTDRKDIMVNAMYAKDISKKIWTSLQRKKEAGYAVGNDAPYGYIRNPVTKRNEIDPEAAFYVQLMERKKVKRSAITSARRGRPTISASATRLQKSC